MAKKKTRAKLVPLPTMPRRRARRLLPAAAAGTPIIQLHGFTTPPPPRELGDGPLEHVRHGNGDQVLTDEMLVGLDGLGQQKFSQAAIDVLVAPAVDDELDILPTGEVYMSHVHIRRRFNRAFGPGGWGLRPLSKPKIEGGTVVLPWALVAEGRSIAVAWGEATYYPDNARVTVATPLESSKSNALTRCAKDLGAGLECWDRRFTATFRRQHCICVRVEHRGQIEWQWRRRDAEPLRGELGQQRDEPVVQQQQAEGVTSWMPRGQDERGPVPQSRPARPITDKQRVRMYAMVKRSGRTEEQVKQHLLDRYKITTSRELKQTDYDAVCEWIMQRGE
jgi:Mitochondrial genome maintenance MGM101